MQQLLNQPSANTFAHILQNRLHLQFDFATKVINIHTIVQTHFIAGKFFQQSSLFVEFLFFLLFTSSVLVRPWNLFGFVFKKKTHIHTLAYFFIRCETKYPSLLNLQSGNIIWTAITTNLEMAMQSSSFFYALLFLLIFLLFSYCIHVFASPG